MSERRTTSSGWGPVGTLLALAAATTAAVAAGRAGDDGTGVPTAAGSTGPAVVKATLTEFTVSLETSSVPAGEVQVEVTNTGKIPHTLGLKGSDLVTKELNGGDTATLSLGELEPGSYTLNCTVPGHAEAGMTTTLTVTEAGAGGSSATPGMGGMGGGDSGAETKDWPALDRAMEESIKKFPAKTEGVGGEVLEPKVLADGTKHFELTAEITDWEVSPGNVVKAWTYNGQVPGPTIKVDPNDKLEIVLHNKLPLGTDVHWHGLRTPNAQDGVAPLTQDLIRPGESYTYRFSVGAPTVAMYHPHHHAQMGIPNGLLGTILVGEVALPTGRTISGIAFPETIELAQEFPMVLNDAGEIGFSLNGKSFPATAPVVANQGDWILVHYLNEGLIPHPMHLHGMEGLVVARDGFALSEPYFVDTILVAPGERFSVLIHADNPGTWAWHCHILNHAEKEEGMFGMVTALIVK